MQAVRKKTYKDSAATVNRFAILRKAEALEMQWTLKF